ncbi:hypothetical protein CDLVIII_0854 [Clostridium sp. DL-VIII]|uniref:hypothetical protein n=1 Tax=Clostridium sp. DL-VIII TaxID=641107 RepID=UPI00023AF11A|nr:hypothetical protein [Clostridium sp. DL-VIII]EHI97578.1 hypothetical protein CDLVIII_0854 [Clostridium sp. DL-VIII]
MAENYEVIKAYGPVIVGIGSLLVAYITNTRILKSKAKEEDRKEIAKNLTNSMARSHN